MCDFYGFYLLEDEVNRYKKARKSLDDKIEVLKRYCYRVKIDETTDKEFNRAKSIHKNIASGEIVEIVTTWNFPEIEALADELLNMLLDMGYTPKEQV